jgi:hypothetical protein
MMDPGRRGTKFELDYYIPMGGAGKTVCLILLAFVLFSCASRHRAPFTVSPPEQRNLSTYENRLQKAVAASPHLRMENIGQDVSMVILKTANGIIDAPMRGLWYMRLTGQLSIANYYRLNNSRFVYTVETPASLMWEDRLKMQQTAVTMLLDQYTGDK